MYIVASLEQSLFIELVATKLELKGIPKKNILAVPLERPGDEIKMFDNINRSDGMSLLDMPAIVGSALMVLGTIYGFILKWGPIICGLAGLLFGACIGLLLEWKTFKKIRRASKVPCPEVILIINCEKDQREMVLDVLTKSRIGPGYN